MLVFPIDDYYAIGAGQDYANGALYMGATAINIDDLMSFLTEQGAKNETRRIK